MFERELRTLAGVPRWSIIRTLRTQSVAEHSYYVAIYADQIAELIEWKGSKYDLFRLAMFHDLDEILSGDIASPAKAVLKSGDWSKFKQWTAKLMVTRFSYFQEWVSSTNSESLAILNAADWLEGVLFLCNEEFQGNQSVKSVRRHCTTKLIESVYNLPATNDVQKMVHTVVLNAVTLHLTKCDALTVDESICLDVKDYMQQLVESEEGEY